MRQSQLITKTRKLVSEQEVSINARLLERAGFISKLMAGVYSYLPLGLRVLTKIEAIVREEINNLGSQEILMPALQPKENWEKTGRWNTVDILYKLTARDQELALGATHEEIVTPLIGQYIQSYKDLPCSVYQIQTKFRNEARPKSGLLRGREFRMKDLYSFHTNQDSLDRFYEQTKIAYATIFTRCGLGDITYLTYASGGIFTKYSHEFQTITPYGEDIIFVCEPCGVAINREIIEDQHICPTCSTADLKEFKAIEVGNIFKLGTRFPEAFNIKFVDNTDAEITPVMGSYGIGTSRLMGAIAEILHDERGILWPLEVAPFEVHLIQLSKNPQVIEQAEQIYKSLQDQDIEVLFDERPEISAGEKFADADLIGIPWRLIISDKTYAQQSVEVKERISQQAQLISTNTLIKFLLDKIRC